MVVFNTAILENWKMTGYKFIYVLPLKKYGVVKPMTNVQDRKKGYTIPINELSRFQLTNNFFMAREKDTKCGVSMAIS